jgi:hypothetical protein
MSDKTRLEALIEGLLQDYLEGNKAARILRAGLDEVGVGLNPVLDHITIRTNDIDTRAQEFVDLGYTYIETLQYGDWFAKVYRPGFRPYLSIKPIRMYEARPV